VSASQKILPGVQSTLKPIHNTQTAFFKSQRNRNACVLADFAVDPEFIRPALLS